jgi:hypothetical protein
MSDMSFSGDLLDLGIAPLTPAQLAAVDPAQLAAFETGLNIPGAERVTQPAQEQQEEEEETVTETEAERIARLNRESAERIARLDRESRAFSPARDARTTIRAVLSTFGLEDLADVVYGEYAAERVNINNPDAVIFSIRNTQQYQKRFAANAKRVAKGLPELDVASYIGLENQYRDLMRANGMPPDFYDTLTDFEKLIEGDVSVVELQSRITQGYRKVSESDPEVKRQMRELYNVDEAGLAAYFLDPTRAAPLLERQAKAAQVSARAREQAGFQLTALSAEDLIARGYTPDEAQQAFTQAGQLAGLYTEMGGEEALTEAQKIGAAFGYDVAATQALEQRKRARLGEFQGGGGFARTTGATSGTVETGVGEAQ